MWNYEKDTGRLAEQAAKEAIGGILKYNEYMSLGCAEPYGEENLEHMVGFLGLCREKIDAEVELRIKTVKERLGKCSSAKQN